MLRCNLARMTIGISFGQFRPRPGFATVGTVVAWLRQDDAHTNRCVHDLRCLFRSARAKGVFYRVFQQVLEVGWWRTSKEDCYKSFVCLHLVTHVLSDCCMSCFVLSSCGHTLMSVVLSNWVRSFVRVLLEHLKRRLLYALFCDVLCLLLVQHVLSTPPVQEKSAGFRSPPRFALQGSAEST